MKADHPISQLCAALGLTTSGYHAWAQAGPSLRQQQDRVLLAQIQTIHTQHQRRYGAPRIQHALARAGQHHGTKRIARLMKQAGLRGLCRRRFVPCTTRSDHDQPIAPNRLAQAPAPTGPNQVWVSDLTCVDTQEGWLYIALVMDLWSRRVVGWSTGSSLHSPLAVVALAMALRHRQPPRGLLHHSDRGVQYASAQYRAVLAAAGLQPSMSRTANPYDNAAMESFIATYKRECVGLSGGYATQAQATQDFFAYVETYYNRQRSHSALGYQTPVDFENQLN